MARLTDPLSLGVFHEGPVTVVRISGSAGMLEADIIREKLLSIAAESNPRIVLDLDELEFISSPGLSAIIAGRHETITHGGRMVLANPTPPIRKVLDTTKLSTIFDVFETLQQAVTSLADKPH